MSQHTCHSNMLRGCHHTAPASQTAAEGAKHLSQYVESHNVCGSFWTTAGEMVLEVECATALINSPSLSL
jgi:hypothetical protein